MDLLTLRRLAAVESMELSKAGRSSVMLALEAEFRGGSDELRLEVGCKNKRPKR